MGASRQLRRHARFEVIDATRDGDRIVTVKIDGTFDKTGLADPLLSVRA